MIVLLEKVIRGMVYQYANSLVEVLHTKHSNERAIILAIEFGDQAQDREPRATTFVVVFLFHIMNKIKYKFCHAN